MDFGAFRAEKLTGHESMRGMVGLQFLLAGMGVVILFSASWYFARSVFDDPFRIWRRQLVWMILGTVSALVLARVPKDWIRKSVPILVWMAFALNLATYVPFLGYSSGGARRWIEVAGLTFQPSEFTRVVVVLYLARMMEKNEDRLDDFRHSQLPPLLVVGILVFSVYFQNDFSTAAYLFLVALSLFFAAGVSWRNILIFIGGIGVSGGLMLAAKPYRLQRLYSWFNPLQDPSGAGYQLLRARSALELGGFWGQGLGRGTIKQGGLPAAHSDFVVAVLGEEAGFIGVAVVLVAFTLFALKGWVAAGKAPDTFSRLGIFGLVGAVYWQALVNFAVVSGVLPATGIPLPLFSAGGSAAFTTLVIFGLIANLAEGIR
ncbi:MAG: FtsW/RodA/SpoVE family cell cycle protein [Spirochaetales bacterium]|nr:FtsW/RodA/SpoVE family cell cycle protein [Spirochaetales bacterium]